MTMFGSHDDAHAVLGASGAARWLACPGSIALSDGLKRIASQYAAHGSVAHDIAAKLLSGTTMSPGRYSHDGFEFDITDDDFAYINQYVDECRGLAGNQHYFIETPVTLEGLFPVNKCPVPLFGTCDFAVIRKDVLVVRDLKYGAGVPVYAKHNPQLMYYALGMFFSLTTAERNDIEWIDMGIVQPRIDFTDLKGNPQIWICHVLELLQWGYNTLKPGVERIVNGDQTLNTGEHCQFCPALHVCPKVKDIVTEVLGMDVTAKTGKLMDTKDLSPDQKAKVLERKQLIYSWVRAVEQHAVADMEEGQTVPGFKLVDKIGYRAWKDEAVVREALSAIDPDLLNEISEQSLISPTQVEKRFKARYASLKPFVHKPVTGITYAPVTDRRPEVKRAPASDAFPDDI